MFETISAKLPPALKTIGIRTKHHNFPVPVFENEPGKFNIFFPDSGTKLLLLKIWSQIPGKTEKLSISFLLWNTVHETSFTPTPTPTPMPHPRPHPPLKISNWIFLFIKFLSLHSPKIVL